MLLEQDQHIGKYFEVLIGVAVELTVISPCCASAKG
jgi:hypothetical protein